MALKFLSIVAAGLLVAACSTDQESASQSGGAGSTAAATNQPVTSSASSNAVSITPGSREEFVAEVGDRIFFGLDQYDLTPEARTTLERQAFWLRKYPSATVTIEGHCDERVRGNTTWSG